MKRSLVIKLTICYAGIIVLLLVLSQTAGEKTVRRIKTEQAVSSLHKEASMIIKEYLKNTDTSDDTAALLEQHISSLSGLTESNIWLVDTEGVIRYDSRSADSSAGTNISDIEPHFLQGQSYTDKTLKGLLNTPSTAVVVPVSSQMETLGYIVVFTPSSKLQESIDEIMYIITICIILFALLLLIAAIYLAFLTIRPAAKISQAAKEFASGNHEYSLKLPAGSEYQDLAASITLMMEELKQSEEYQRKFIANISHDFRSPLTSIKGYAQAIKDGTIPPELLEKYMDIILFEAERLTKLTTNLLDLSQLDTGNLLLDYSDFDINATIKQIAASFEQKCAKKKLSFRLSFEKEQIIVHADSTRIQQVLYNLIDNAIKFSDTDSTIDIITEENSGKIFVSIRDHGRGIDKAEQKRIWDRFYKSDSSRGKDKKGTGLGLPIAREIINAHGESIDVISTPGVGSEFIFTLTIPDGDEDALPFPARQTHSAEGPHTKQ